ncbi:MAG: hypothetical protein AABZ12_02300 [Planctomycetota bacterium]
MRYRMAFVGFLGLLLGADGAVLVPADESTSGSRPAEIHAKCWFNAQPVRLYDPPRLILLEFWSTRSRESLQLVKSIAALHEHYHDKGLLVVALTSDDCDEAERFTRREKIKYKVGGESRSPKKYAIENLPGVVLLDANDHRIVGRWQGKEVSKEALAKAIEEFFRAPGGAAAQSAGMTPEEHSELVESVAAATNPLGNITSEILAIEGEIGPEALAPLKRFYEANLPDDTALDDVESRTRSSARWAILGADRDVGYGKLLESGRLSEAARAAIRDSVLEMARNDPAFDVRTDAIHALRGLIGVPGDPVLLEALRQMREEAEADSFVRASLDQAIRELDPATREQAKSRTLANKLARQLRQSANPAATPWADAHAYSLTTGQRATEQLLEDYEAFDDPASDEIGQQNATLKRSMTIDELGNRVVRGEIQDLREVKELLGRGLSQEPDSSLRMEMVSTLNTIARSGGRGLRVEIIELFEKRLAEETDGYVRAALDGYSKELKGK